MRGYDFFNGKVNWQSSYHVDEERYQEDPYIHLRENDLLITKDGTIGKTAVVKQLSGKATLNSGIFLTRPLKGIYVTDFMYWILNSKVFTDFIDLSKTGTTISHLYQNVFVRFNFPLPPLPEQQAIADFLDHKTGRIDSLIGKKQRLVELLKEKRTALISRAVTKGLNASVKMKPSGVEWLWDVPENWEVKRLKYCFSLITKKADSDDNPIGLENIESWTGRFIETKSEFEGDGISFHAGDILFGKLRPYLAKVYLAASQGESIGDIFVLRPIQKVTSNYAADVLRSDIYIEVIDGSTYGSKMPRASWEFMGNLLFPLPPLPEQQAIADFLNRETAKIDKLGSKVETAIEKLKEYRTALISAAVTGKIDVREGK